MIMATMRSIQITTGQRIAPTPQCMNDKRQSNLIQPWVLFLTLCFHARIITDITGILQEAFAKFMCVAVIEKTRVEIQIAPPIFIGL